MTALAVLVSTLLLAAPGKPPSPEEQKLFEEGMRAFQAGNAHDADKAWRAGYALGRDPAFLVRMGEAEEKAGQPAEAAESYRRYLRAASDASDRAEIEQRLTRLGPAGAAAAATPAAPPEAHEVPGAFGDAGPAPGTMPAPPAAAAQPARDDELARHGAGEEEPSGWNAVSISAWVATGATVMLLGVAGYYAASAGSQKDDVNLLLLRFQDPMTGARVEYQTVAARYEQATREGQHDDRVAKGALIAAAGTALVATALFIVDAVRMPEGRAADKQARRAVTPSIGFLLRSETGQATALSSLRWSF